MSDEGIVKKLVTELYTTKEQLKIAEEKIRECEFKYEEAQEYSRNNEYILQSQLFEAELQIRKAQDREVHQNRLIVNLEACCMHLQNENDFLKDMQKEQQRILTEPLQPCVLSGLEGFSLSNAFFDKQQDSHNNIAGSFTESVSPEGSLLTFSEHFALPNCFDHTYFGEDMNSQPESTFQEKAMTIAEKLKLCPNPKSPEPCPVASKRQENKKKWESHQLRLFVGRLNPGTTETTLKEYFAKFGPVTDVFIPRVDGTVQHRGFAFVTFAEFYGDHPLKTPKKHVIDGRVVFIDISSYAKSDKFPTKTLLVSGLIHQASEEALKRYFSKFGPVETIVRTKEGQHFSRWAFIHFKHQQSVDKALDVQNVICGVSVDCRRAHDFHIDENKKQTKKSDRQSVKRQTTNKITKLLINHLTPSITTKELKEYFEKFGTVIDAYIPTVYGTGTSKGFGYIVMPSNEAGFNFHDHILDGKKIFISKDDPSVLNYKTKTLLVSAGPEIMKKLSESDLEQFFTRFGKIVSVRKFTDPYTKLPSHYAFVEFTSTKPVDDALKSISYVINDHVVTVTKSRNKQHSK